MIVVLFSYIGGASYDAHMRLVSEAYMGYGQDHSASQACTSASKAGLFDGSGQALLLSFLLPECQLSALAPQVPSGIVSTHMFGFSGSFCHCINAH